MPSLQAKTSRSGVSGRCPVEEAAASVLSMAVALALHLGVVGCAPPPVGRPAQASPDAPTAAAAMPTAVSPAAARGPVDGTATDSQGPTQDVGAKFGLAPDDEPSPAKAVDPNAPLDSLSEPLALTPPAWPAAQAPPTGLRKRPPPPHTPEVARARRWLERGLASYRRGDYTKAEDELKQAVTLYPFFAEANLALGKIFLMRGSAMRDRALLHNAQLMFEMARTLDPSIAETYRLLDLFAVPGAP